MLRLTKSIFWLIVKWKLVLALTPSLYSFVCIVVLPRLSSFMCANSSCSKQPQLFRTKSNKYSSTVRNVWRKLHFILMPSFASQWAHCEAIHFGYLQHQQHIKRIGNNKKYIAQLHPTHTLDHNGLPCLNWISVGHRNVQRRLCEYRRRRHRCAYVCVARQPNTSNRIPALCSVERNSMPHRDWYTSIFFL